MDFFRIVNEWVCPPPPPPPPGQIWQSMKLAAHSLASRISSAQCMSKGVAAALLRAVIAPMHLLSLCTGKASSHTWQLAQAIV